MREILFRGKCVDNGEWVYGYYAVKGAGTDYEKHFICESTFDARTNCYPFYFTDFEVDPETIGQYTGMADKNGVKIFEGDVVEHILLRNVRTGCVEYGTGCGAFCITGSGYSNNLMCAFYDFKVVGNIHDNPELLKEG